MTAVTKPGPNLSVPQGSTAADRQSPAPTPSPNGYLQAIERGETVRAEIHDAVRRETPVLEIQSFCLWYGLKQALFDIELLIPKGKVTALIGPSGCGKSTLLRSINRLNDLVDNVRVTGSIALQGQPIYAGGVDVIELRKRCGMVFQKSNPFPISIFDNVVYGLRIAGERNKKTLAEACEKA